MTNEADAPKKNRMAWNPFQKLGGEDEVRGAAKSGVLVSGYIALSYAVQVAFLYWSGTDLFGNVGLGPLIVDVFAVALAVFLTWRIIARQPVWAAVFSAVWFVAELVGKIMAVVAGEQPRGAAGFALMFFFITCAAILSVRASIRLRSLRKPRPAPIVASGGAY